MNYWYTTWMAPYGNSVECDKLTLKAYLNHPVALHLYNILKQTKLYTW